MSRGRHTSQDARHQLDSCLGQSVAVDASSASDPVISGMPQQNLRSNHSKLFTVQAVPDESEGGGIAVE